VFRNRSRPCLQHQIGRCSAPCVGLVAPRDYDADVRRAALFLDGRGDELVDEMARAMEQASERLDFEQAAVLRDQVAGIRGLQARQYVESGAHADMDVLACVASREAACVLLMAFRHGMNHGTRAFFPKANGEESPAEVLGAFVSQYYLEQAPPREIVLSHPIEDLELIEAVLAERAGHRVELKPSVRGDRARFLDMAMRNAGLALATERSGAQAQRARLESLTALLGLAAPPARMECFDISHTMGEATVASCVVFNEDGPVRGQYRRFNIAGITAGDDYAAMRQALERRFRRAVEEGVVPDLLFIDGGAGQLAQATEVLAALGLDRVLAVGVAKGEERRPGHETLVFPDGREIVPGSASPGLQLVQQIRDEAHRFAITGHRGRRQKVRETSRLEDIAGIGPRRRANLLKHFGGMIGLKAAGVEEIARVEGINAQLAQRIYHSLHGLAEPEAPA
jgi:excinuclease ABC subunit C